MDEITENLMREPRYGVAEAARLVGMSASRVRRWLRGYQYKWNVDGETKYGSQDPVVQHEKVEESQGASFLDLIELLFARAFVDKGFPLQKIRAALDEARGLLRLDYPFARRRFFTDGSEIYLQLEKNSARHLLQLFSGGQWAIPEVIHSIAEQIRFDDPTGLPLDWWPRGRKGGVFLSPRISFGAPTLARRHVKTSNVYDLFLAEGRSLIAVADWYAIEPDDVKAAVEFEQELLAA